MAFTWCNNKTKTLKLNCDKHTLRYKVGTKVQLVYLYDESFHY